MKYIVFLIAVISPMWVSAQSMQIGPGDQLEIFVAGNPDLSSNSVVRMDGSITLPLIGKVDLEGKTSKQAEVVLKNQLITGGFLRKPEVTVSILDAVKNKVSILGQVAKPGQYKISPAVENIIDLIAVAGGVGPSSEVVVLRKSLKGFERFSLNIEKLILEAGTESLNNTKYQLASQDVVYVKSEPVFYTFGELASNSVFPLKDGLILRQAISIAGGLTPIAKSNVNIMRLSDDGTYQTISATMDTVLIENDIIVAEESLF